MIALLSFLLGAAILVCEGYLLVRMLSGATLARSLQWLLGYPAGALLNALVFFAAYLAHVPFTALTIGGMHALLVVALFLSSRRSADGGPRAREHAIVAIPRTPFTRMIVAAGVASLVVVALSSAFYAVVLPTYYWDSFMNWQMRAAQMLQARSLLFEGVAKPQYPVLLHSLQMLPALFAGWNDRTANAMTFLLSCTSLTSLALLIRRSYGTMVSVLALALLTAVPLAIVHLRQGYGDIHVATYLLLSAFLLERFVRERKLPLLVLSLLFVVAASWTKLEGLTVGVLSWALLAAYDAWSSRSWSRAMRFTPLLLSVALLWPALILFKGLSLSPEGAALGLHPEALPLYADQVLLRGSFGVYGFVLPALTAAFLIAERRKFFASSNALTLYGLLTLAFVSGVYLCTAEVKGIIDQNSFSRTMLIPVLLLTLALTLRAVERLATRRS